MQRLVWYARAELSLANDEPGLALQIVERMITSTRNISGERPVLRLSKFRAEALMALGKTTEAEADLLAARKLAIAQEEPALLWRIHLALNRLYKTQARMVEAEDQFSAAQEIMGELAANIPEDALRHNFRRNADRFLSS